MHSCNIAIRCRNSKVVVKQTHGSKCQTSLQVLKTVQNVRIVRISASGGLKRPVNGVKRIERDVPTVGCVVCEKMRAARKVSAMTAAAGSPAMVAGMADC